MAYINVNNLNNTLDILYNQDASNNRYKLKIYVGDVKLENVDSYCERLTIKSRIIPNGSKQFMLNTLVSKEAELILHDIDTNNISGQLNISIGILTNEEAILDEERYEYIPMGIFNIDGEPTSDKGRTIFTLRDNSVLLDYPYNAQPLIEQNGGKATKLQIFEDICTQFNIETDITEFLNSNDEIGIYDNTINARIYIAYLSEQAGCMATFDRDGKLIFVNMLDLYKWTLPFEYMEKYENSNKYTISKVVYEDGIRSFVNGNDENDKMFLDSSNPYISNQEQVNEIANKILGFSINSLKTGKIKGNPLIDSYDLIEFTNNDGIAFTTLGNNEFVYNGVLRQTFDTEIGLDERKQNVSAKGEATFRKYAKTSIDNINNNIEMIVGEQNAQSEQIAQVIQNVNSIQNIFQVTGGNNLIKNSQGLLEDEVWTEQENKTIIGYDENNQPIYDANSITTFVKGYDVELVGKTVAVAKLGVSNGILTTTEDNITNLVIGTKYTLNYFITNEEDTETTIRLIGNTTIYEKTFTEECEMQEEIFEFTANTSNYIFQIESKSLYNNFVYIYDLMLNSGDKKSWEVASGEIVGTIIQLSRMGLRITCTGTNIASLMTAQGFQIRRFQNGQLYEVITEFTDKGITTNEMSCKQENINGLIRKTVQSSGYVKYITYIGGND